MNRSTLPAARGRNWFDLRTLYLALRFRAKGVPKERVVIRNIHRSEPPGFAPALNHWTITGDNWKDALKALADRIRLMLAAPEAMKVVDRADGAARTLRPADIAVLCRRISAAKT